MALQYSWVIKVNSRDESPVCTCQATGKVTVKSLCSPCLHAVLAAVAWTIPFPFHEDTTIYRQLPMIHCSSWFTVHHWCVGSYVQDWSVFIAVTDHKKGNASRKCHLLWGEIYGLLNDALLAGHLLPLIIGSPCTLWLWRSFVILIYKNKHVFCLYQLKEHLSF